MEKVLFSGILKKYLPKMSRLVQLYNEQKNRPEYMFKTMLTPRFSVNQTWNSSYYHNHIVAADVVAMDSNLPLKKRDKIRVATGDLSKIGMKIQMKESELNELQLLQAQGLEDAVTEMLLAPAVKCTMGIDERLEFLFLQGLSNGYCAVADDYNTGIGVRVDFGYQANHKGFAVHGWEDKINATPITDLEKMIDKASKNGDSIRTIMMDKSAFENLRASQEAKELAATFKGISLPTTATNYRPNAKTLAEAIEAEFGVKLIIVNRSTKITKDGIDSSVNPWNSNKVIFLSSETIGILSYGRLAEEGEQSEAAVYAKPTAYTLLKKWQNEEPFAMYTSAQAIAFPVPYADKVYQLDIADAETIAEPTDPEGDAYIYLFNVRYLKTAVVEILSAFNDDVTTNSTDEEIRNIINTMPKDKLKQFKYRLGE